MLFLIKDRKNINKKIKYFLLLILKILTIFDFFKTAFRITSKEFSI